MRSIYTTLLLLAAAVPLLADDQSDCMAKGSPNHGVVFWTGDEVYLDKADSLGNIKANSSGTTKGCMELDDWDGQIRIGDHPHPHKDSRTCIETNPVGEWATYDVSYILGYSHTVVCKDVVQGTLSGDNLDLWSVADTICDSPNNYTCINPVGPWGIHAPAMATESCWNCNPPNHFFAPVAGAAYTYPNDNQTVISASSNKIVCCVGKDCPWSNPKAGSSKGGCGGCGSGADKRDVEIPISEPKPKRHLHGHGKHKARGLSEFV